MASVNQALADLVLQHRHYLLAVEEHALAQMGRVFDKALREVRTTMARVGFDPRTFTGQRLVRLEKQLAGMVELSAQAAGGELKATLREIIQAENVAQTGILLDALPKPMEVLISFERLPLAQIEQMIQTPLGGKTLNDRLKTMVAGAADDVRSALATSITLGEGIDPAARRIRQYVKGKTMYNAQRIARTEIHRAATAAQLHVYRRHKNILAGLTWYATLDRRTCAACAELDQMMWHYDRPPLLSEAPEPPLHPACRCTMVPSTKSWKQLGFDKQDLKGFPGLKDLDGKLARVPGYGVWFKRQPKDVQLAILGRKRWLDWKAGRFKLRDMVSTIPRRLKPLSPDQLAKVRGLGRRAKPKRRVVQPGKRAFKASEIRALINAEALKAGMSRKQLATYWRDVRAGRRLSLREQLASILNVTEVDAAAVTKKVLDFQVAVHRRLRALVKEAQALSGANKVPGAAVRRTLRATYKEPATKSALHALIRDYVVAANAQDPLLGMTFDEALEAFNEGMRTLRGTKFVKHGGGAIIKGHGDASVTIVVGGYKPSITARLRPARAFSMDQYTSTPEWYNRQGLVVAVPDGAAFGYRERCHSVLLDVSQIIELGGSTTAGEVEELRVAFHELGHTWEYSDPRVNRAARRFFDRRTRGEATRRLRDISPFGSFDYDERAKPDRFWKAYVGKVYGDDEVPREVFSMATEHLPGLNMARPLQKGVAGDAYMYISPAARNAVDWATYDPEHFELLLNAVAGAL